MSAFLHVVMVSVIIVATMVSAGAPQSGAVTDTRMLAQDPVPDGVSLQEPDGGRNFFGRYPGSLPAGQDFFPIGVWFESVLQTSDLDLDRAAGINTYVQLTDNSDLSLIRANGSHAMPSAQSPFASGYLVSDEVDMWAGGGSNKWTGNQQGEGVICSPADSGCGFTVQEALTARLPAGALRYSNYGKGVTFHLKNPAAAQFVNKYQDVVSADNYWFTDPYICSLVEGGAVFGNGRDLSNEECRVAAHYGWTVDRVRSLVNPAGSKPVWAFVELGHPFSEPESLSITAPQIRAAVWSSIIHGARGIVYFNHSFGGDCISQHILREDCGEQVRPTVTAVNRQIASLALVLNSPSVNGLVSADSSGIDVSVRVFNGNFYVLAAANRGAEQSVTFTLACGRAGAATVLDEGRSLKVSANAFTDSFANANAVHIYRLEGGNTCGLG
ncbi:MAG: hypothetical protein ABWY04_04950 [Arthrobacter sp.]